MSTNNPLSKLIISECENRGWTPADLYRNAKISKSAGYRILKGSKAVSTENISNVLYVLNLLVNPKHCEQDQSKEIERLNKIIDQLMKEIERLEKSS